MPRRPEPGCEQLAPNVVRIASYSSDWQVDHLTSQLLRLADGGDEFQVVDTDTDRHMQLARVDYSTERDAVCLTPRCLVKQIVII